MLHGLLLAIAVTFSSFTLSAGQRPPALSGGERLPNSFTYPPTLVEPCKGKAVGDSCVSDFGRGHEGRCILGRDQVMICGPGEPKRMPKEIVSACDGLSEKATCDVELDGRSWSGHCNLNRITDQLLCLPGPWPWRDGQ